MTTAKWMLCIIAASITSSCVTFHFNKPNENQFDAALNFEKSSHLKFSDSNPAPHIKLEKINNGDVKSLNQTAGCIPDVGVNSAVQTALTSPVTFKDVQFAYEKKQNEIASFRGFIERKGGRALSAISNNFDSEPLDPEWARSKEDELLAILDANETLQNTAPVELSCKSQNCRLVLSVHDENQGQSLYSAFKDEVLQGDEDNKKQVVSYFSSPDSGEIHIYLSRNSVRELIDGKIN